MEIRKRGVALVEQASGVFDIPGEVVCGLPRVTVTGGRRVNVENHRGLLEYGPERISVATAAGVVRIRGDGLALDAMTDAELAATGTVVAVEFVM